MFFGHSSFTEQNKHVAGDFTLFYWQTPLESTHRNLPGTLNLYSKSVFVCVSR